VSSAAISPNFHLVAAGYEDAIVRLWEIRTGQLVDSLVGHNDSVVSVAFTPDGNGLISGGADGMVKSWNLEPLLMHMQTVPALMQLDEVDVQQAGLAAKEGSGQDASVPECMVDFIGHTVCNRSLFGFIFSFCCLFLGLVNIVPQWVLMLMSVWM
jgi:general transcriptional corepressor TUP1